MYHFKVLKDYLFLLMMQQYDEVRKTTTGQDDDYTTGCLLDYAYFKDNYRLISVDLSK